jgi:hypothetical protein
LAFLAKSQNPDGSFDRAGDINRRAEITGLSLLAFVSAGDAPDLGKFGSAVRAATNNLMQATSSPKLSENVRQSLLFALNQVAGIDDEAEDQTLISQLLQRKFPRPMALPFSGRAAIAWQTLPALLSRNRFGIPKHLSYSLLYRAALIAADLRLAGLSEEVDQLLLLRQRPDGSWNGDVRSTALAVLALTAKDELMQG